MHLDRTAEDLIRRGEMAPIIIVAIAAGPSGQRTNDYTPWPTPYWQQPNGGGDFYVRAVRDTLKPAIDRQFRTRPDRDNTAMAGCSLGGLISAYALFAYDSTFARAGAFSPSYWYRGLYANIYTVVSASWWNPSHVRLYEDTGDTDDNDIRDMESTLTREGFRLGVDLMSVTAPGGDHTIASWTHRAPDMLRFLFPPPSPPS
jgi:predicted alpha/beta superfamily hydrolase